MQRTTKSVLCILSLVIAIGLWLKATGIQVPSGTWAPSGNMAEERSGAASVLLQDGTILVTGGEGASVTLASAEFFNAGSFASAPAMNVARSRHAAVVLQDGRVMVSGGKTTGGSATNAAEIYSPALNSWIVVASMADARSGHTATLLKDGRVLLTGGEGSAGALSTLEVFDPVAGTFTFVGTMSSARKNHAAALLADGRALIAGGSDGANALASTEIYDSETGAVAAGPVLSTPRVGLSATTLMDGRVLIAGGNNGTADLTTAEIFNSETGVLSPLGSPLATSRRNHSAFLLPHNNHVLIVGGTSSGTPLATTELFRPWEGNFYPTGSMSLGRPGSSGSPLGLDGLLLVVGGNGLAGSELYGFATVKTDKDDYAPGELVTMTGSGWQPGETVTLFLHEINNPDPHDDLTLTAVADASGRIVNSQFAPDEHDIGIRFYLTASGANSQAWTTFTDGNLSSTISFSIGPTPVAPGGTLNWNVSATCANGGGPNTCASEGYVSGGPVQNGYTVDIQQATDAAFTLNLVLRQTMTTTAGTASGSFAAPSTGGPYFYRARHANQDLSNTPVTGNDPNSWQPQNSNSVTITLAAANTTPTVTLSGDATANEGETKHYTFDTSDPDAGETFTLVTASCGLNGTKSNQVFSASTGDGSFDCTFPDGPANSTVSVQVSDGDASDTKSITVAIANLPPVVVLTGDATANEGQTKTYSFTVTDPGQDSFAVKAGFPDCGTGGNLVAGSLTTNSGGGSFQCSFPDGPASPTVRMQVEDTDEIAGSLTKDSNIATVAVTVSNVAPAVAFTAPATTADEGQSKTYAFTVTDPGQDTFTVKTGFPDCGTGGNLVGTATVNATGGSFQCGFPDGPAGPTVRMQVEDTDEAPGSLTKDSNIATVVVTVNNVAPAVAITAPATTADEGQTKSYTFTVTDPGQDTFTVKTGFPDCGTGGNLVGTATVNATGGSFQCSFPDGPASPTVRMQVEDTDEAPGSLTKDSNIATVAVTVNNVAPAVIFTTAPTTADEGQTKSYTFTVTDPGQDTFTVKMGFPDCGTGGNLVGTATLNATGGSFQCSFPDGPASPTVRMQVEDTDEAAGSLTKNSTIVSVVVTISNVSPSVRITGPASGAVFPVGYAVPFTGTFTDPGTLDTHTYQWTFDSIIFPMSPASVTSEPSNGNPGTVNTSYSFTTPGVYQIKLTVTDDDGGSGDATTVGADGLIAQVVIYDPNGGFVTGGGWIDSPLNAYLYDRSLTGKATFGFVSKYLKGATTPTGQTEFQFKAGNFNFHSSYYEWLVVAGAKAQYKGVGEINGFAAPPVAGASNYKFMLTAIDGQSSGGGGYDKFRIKIWYEVGAAANVVYDNKPGATDDFESAPTQPLGGGSIVVHK